MYIYIYPLLKVSKYVYLRSSFTHLWFSAACAAAIVHRNQFFVCTKGINLLILKSSSHRLVIIAKGFFKLPNLHMLITKKSITSQKTWLSGL